MMKVSKRVSQFLIGLAAVFMASQLAFRNGHPAIAQMSNAAPICLSDQPYATSGGSEKLINKYEGVNTDYWLYYTYGASDTAQQYAMELVLTTTVDSCDVAYWNAAGHSFSYATVVPMDVAKQFSLAGFQQHLNRVGQQAFETYYASADPSLFFEEDLWALRQLGIDLQ